MDSHSIIITRGRVGQVASFIGATALLIGILGVIWQGGITLYVALPLALGIIGLALWAIMTPDDFVGFFTGRRTLRSTTAVFSTLLLIGVVALVYILLQRGALTLDMTLAERFTLSPETADVLRRVDRPIRITGFYSPAFLGRRELDDEFFRLYEAATNGLISRQYIDPDQEPAVAQRYGVTSDGQVFISYVNPDGSTDFNTLARVPLSNTQERDMTEAISRLLISGTLSVYFDQGLGERDPLENSQEGISGINNGVKESGLNTYPLNIVDLANQGKDIPDNAAAVIFARPLTDLDDTEIGIIDRYLKKGGSIFLMADVLFNANPFLQQNGKFNQYLWNNYGIHALDAAVVDPTVSGQTALDVISAYVFPQTEIGSRIDPTKNPTAFHLARAVDISGGTLPPNVANGRVIMSSQQSYGETDLKTLGETNTFHYDQGVDLPGPLTTVVWATNKQTNAKIVLVGDSDFVTNGMVLSGGNGILFTDSVAWLTGLGDRIHFAPQAYGVGMPLIFVSAQTLDLIAFLTIILLPGVVLAAGVAVRLRRGRR